MPTYEIKSPDGKTYEVTAPDGASQHDVMSYVQQQHAGAQKSGGTLDSIVRSAANAATFNLADPIAAAANAVLPIEGGSSHASSFGQRYRENRDMQQQKTAASFDEHPVASVAGAVGGGFLNPVGRALPAANTLKAVVGQGAGLGAGYGLGDAVAKGDDLNGAIKDTLMGAGTGGAFGAGLHGLGKLVRGATQSADAALLNRNDIPTTIGQDLGGGYKRAEDAFTSMPYGGDAIIARQKEGLGGFNRALENDALAPVQMQVPAATAPGNEAGRYLAKINGLAYDAAYNGATVQHTPALVADLQSATNHMSQRLLPDAAAIDHDIQNHVISRFDPTTGRLSERDFNDAKNWLAEQAATTSNMTPDQRSVAKAYENALTALKKGFAATDPGRGDMLKRADAMYARRMPLINAAGNTNASAKDGIVTPAQYSRALDSSDGSAHSLQYSLGNMPLQDMVQAAQRVLPSAVPDSGTGVRRLLTGGIPAAIGATVGAGAAGIPGLATAALPLLLTRALYSKTGQKAAKAALFGAPKARAAISKTSPILLSGALPLLTSQGQ